jgi:hypothetical protein
MELKFRNSFFRDLDNIKSQNLKTAIQKLLVKAQTASSPASISGMKQLKRTKAFEYKIELKVHTKVYWILCDIQKERIVFIRIKSEAWCKRQLGY